MSVKRVFFSALMLSAIVLAPTSAFAQQQNDQQGQMSEQEAQRMAQEAERRARAQEAAVQAQMRQIEAGIAHYEKQLEQRMAEAGRLRQAALQKNDQRGLDRAAEYEKQAIAAYEAAINKLIQAVNNPPQQGAQRGAPQQGQTQQQGRQQPPRQQRRRSGWSWWPFG